jgi:hypothetical protein
MSDILNIDGEQTDQNIATPCVCDGWLIIPGYRNEFAPGAVRVDNVVGVIIYRTDGVDMTLILMYDEIKIGTAPEWYEQIRDLVIKG